MQFPVSKQKNKDSDGMQQQFFETQNDIEIKRGTEVVIGKSAPFPHLFCEITVALKDLTYTTEIANIYNNMFDQFIKQQNDALLFTKRVTSIFDDDIAIDQETMEIDDYVIPSNTSYVIDAPAGTITFQFKPFGLIETLKPIKLPVKKRKYFRTPHEDKDQALEELLAELVEDPSFLKPRQ